MKVNRFDNAEAFLKQVTLFLLEREAQHNLILGIAAEMARGESHYAQPTYFATVEQRGAVVAAALRTPPHGLHLTIAPPAAIDLLATSIRAMYRTLPSVFGPRETSRAFAGTWQQLTGQTARPGTAQRIYQLEAVTPVAGVSGGMRRATTADRTLLAEWFAAFEAETSGERDDERAERQVEATLASSTRTVFVWEDRQPVSMAEHAGPTPNGIRVGRVYTPPRFRGNGYASACVAELSQHLLRLGYRYCFLFTDLANPTANRIYQRIGYQPVVDADEFVFEGARIRG